MLKRESRILGLSGTRVGYTVILIGVVFRGSLWLDGVVTASMRASQQTYNLEISKMVRTSKQFSQLHAIIVSPLLMLLGKTPIPELSRRMKLPVIALTKSRRAPKSNQRMRESGLLNITMNRTRRTASFSGASKEHAEQLYQIACNSGNSLPEPVRLADRLAKQLRNPRRSS